MNYLGILVGHMGTQRIMETCQPGDNHAHCPLRGKRKFMLELEWVNRTAPGGRRKAPIN